MLIQFYQCHCEEGAKRLTKQSKISKYAMIFNILDCFAIARNDILKKYLIILIRAPIIFFSLLSGDKICAQIQIGLHILNYDLSVNSIINDTAFVGVTTKKGHATKKLSAQDFLI